MMFHQLELVVRRVFNKEKTLTEMSCNLRDKVKESIQTDENIQFYWCMLTTDIEDDKASILLSKIVDLFITIRGFSFTRSFMELYKQSMKKSTQKSKALRKTIYSKAAS